MNGSEYIWLWNSQEYDWMGRVTRSIPSDSSGTDGKDTLIEYTGCGCAGGLVTTAKGPVTTAVDIGGTTQTTKRRTQKAYEDILGRTFKTEIWDLDGAGSAPYSTVKTTFNGRDQATLVREYAGADSSGTFQDTTAAFDGHGRLATSHKPEQRDSSNNEKYTTYSYNLDDSIATVTDGRDVVTNYTYNNRRLVTNIGWDVGSTGVTDVTDVAFQYDNLGNRTSMNDGLGSVSYEYNSLSQMTAETRDFTDTLVDSPISGGQYKLEYTYTIGGQLKSYKDPWEKEIAYTNDKTGRLTAVTGTSFGGVTSYANNPGYRAWGGLKHLEYGNGVEMDMTFNNRLQPDQFDLSKGTTEIMKKNYEYLADGKLKSVDDELVGIFDRLNVYDHVGRIKQGKSSTEASGTEVTSNQDTQLPYRQSYTFNAFDNLTQRDNLHWGINSWQGYSNNLSYTYENNRITNSNWIYDADGRAMQSSWPDRTKVNTFDARGMLIRNLGVAEHGDTDVERYFDGDRREGKRASKEYSGNSSSWVARDNEYFIRSTVLGGAVISETRPTGSKKQTFVYAAGAKIATQFEYTYNSTTTESVSFDHTDAAGMSYRSSLANGSMVYGDGAYDGAPAELDPMGGNAGLSTPYITPVEPPPATEYFPFLTIAGDSPMFVNGQQVSCTLDGMSIGCSMAMNMLNNGSAIPAAYAQYQHLPGFQFNSHGFGIYTANIPGHHFSTPNSADSGDIIRIGSYGYQPPTTYSFSLPVTQWGFSPRTETATTSGIKPDPKRILSAINTCLKSVFGSNTLEATGFTGAANKTNGLLNVRNPTESWAIETGMDFNLDTIRTASNRSRGLDGQNRRIGGFTPMGSPGSTFEFGGRTYSNDGRRANYVANNNSGYGHLSRVY